MAGRESGFANKTREWADILIPVIRKIARMHGYALAVHGSLSYDIDLVAVPWVDVGECHPTGAESLAESVRELVKAVIGFDLKTEGPTQKPHGRLAWSFHLGGGPYIDLSITPRLDSEGKARL